MYNGYASQDAFHAAMAQGWKEQLSTEEGRAQHAKAYGPGGHAGCDHANDYCTNTADSHFVPQAAENKTITAEQLAGVRAWASVLEASLRDPARADRVRDDAHDLVMNVSFLLETVGADLIWNDPEAADKALGEWIVG